MLPALVLFVADAGHLSTRQGGPVAAKGLGKDDQAAAAGHIRIQPVARAGRVGQGMKRARWHDDDTRRQCRREVRCGPAAELIDGRPGTDQRGGQVDEVQRGQGRLGKAGGQHADGVAGQQLAQFLLQFKLLALQFAVESLGHCHGIHQRLLLVRVGLGVDLFVGGRGVGGQCFGQCQGRRDRNGARQNLLQPDVGGFHDGQRVVSVFHSLLTVGHKAAQLSVAQANGQQPLGAPQVLLLRALDQRAQVADCLFEGCTLVERLDALPHVLALVRGPRVGRIGIAVAVGNLQIDDLVNDLDDVHPHQQPVDELADLLGDDHVGAKTKAEAGGDGDPARSADGTLPGSGHGQAVSVDGAAQPQTDPELDRDDGVQRDLVQAGRTEIDLIGDQTIQPAGDLLQPVFQVLDIRVLRAFAKVSGCREPQLDAQVDAQSTHVDAEKIVQNLVQIALAAEDVPDRAEDVDAGA